MQDAGGEEQVIHLRDYLKVIYKRRQTAFTIFIVVFVVVLIGTLSTTPIYRASTKLIIEKSEARNLMMNYMYMPYDPEFYETQNQLIKSTSVARKVVDMLALDKSDYFARNARPQGSLTGIVMGWLRNAWSVVFRTKGVSELGSKADAEARADMIAKTISAGIEVRPVKNSRIVEIGYLSPSPELAKAVADNVARAYIEEVLELNMSSTRHTLEWMNKKAEEELEKMEKAEKALQTYVKSQNLVTVENKLAIVPQQMSELNTQLIKAEAKRKEIETVYAKVKGLTNLSDAENISVVASDPTLLTLKQGILKAEQNIMEYSQKYGKKHPIMIRAVEDLNGLKARKDQEIRRIIESIKNDYEMARSNETTFRRQLGESKADALNLNEKYMEYQMLNREAETNRQLYDALIKKIKEQNITEQVQTVNLLIIEKAETPRSPIKPRKAANAIMGLIIGLLGGVGMAFFVEYLDQTVKSPEDAEARLGIPVLGMIPLQAAGGPPVEQLTLGQQTSAFAENFKAVRTALLLSTADRPPKQILVTSTGPSEGKTVTAVNLAITIAQSEYSVLLIDADLRKPRIHGIFGLGNARGLSTYLAGASDMDIVHQGPLPRLSIITAGPIPPNPSELLGSNRMQEMIASLSSRFDIIICDSPPILSVTDSLILDSMLDSTIMVARAGKTTYDAALKGIKALLNLKSHIVGLVINAFDVKKNEYSYYRYHNYYYAEEEHEAPKK